MRHDAAMWCMGSSRQLDEQSVAKVRTNRGRPVNIRQDKHQKATLRYYGAYRKNGSSILRIPSQALWVSGTQVTRMLAHRRTQERSAKIVDVNSGEQGRKGR